MNFQRHSKGIPLVHALLVLLFVAMGFHGNFQVWGKDVSENFLIPNGPEIGNALDQTLTLEAKDEPLHDLIHRLRRDWQIPLRIMENVPNPRVSLEATERSLRETLWELHRLTGVPMLCGFIQITLLNTGAEEEIREREAMLSLGQSGNASAIQITLERLLGEFLDLKDTGLEYSYFRRLVALNRPDLVLSHLFHDFESQDGAGRDFLLQAAGRFLRVYPILMKNGGFIEDRYYLSSRKYSIPVNQEALEEAVQTTLGTIETILLDGEKTLRPTALLALRDMGQERATDLLLEALKRPEIQLDAAWTLASVRNDAGYAVLMQGLEAVDVESRVRAAEGLMALKDDSGFPALMEILGRPAGTLDENLIRKILFMLHDLRRKESAPLLLEQLRGPCPDEALTALERLTGQRSREPLILKGNPELTRAVYERWQVMLQNWEDTSD